MDITNLFNKEILQTNFKQLTPVIIEAFLKKMDEVGGYVHHQIFRLTEQNNLNASDEQILESVVQKPEDMPRENWEFRKKVMKEWQRKMKYIETQIKIIELVFSSRGISKEDRENLSIDELLKMN